MKFKIPTIKNPSPNKKEAELYDPRIHGIRQSHLSTFFECQEKARLGVIHGWSQRVASVPFIYGSLSHGVLKAATRDIRSGFVKDLPNLIGSVPSYLLMSEKEWLAETPNPTVEQKDILESSMHLLGKKMKHYFAQWGKEDLETEWSLAEDKFKVNLTMDDGEVVPLIGTFDSTFVMNGEPYLFETKNKARWGSQIGTYLPLDLQLGIYITAMGVLYDQQPAGVKYNLLRRPGERQKKGETMEEFTSRIEQNIIKDPDHYFERLSIKFLPQELEEHVERTLFICQSFYDWWKRTMKTVNKRDLMWNSGSCDGKYGTCRFLDLCANQDYTLYEKRSPAIADGLENIE